MDPSTNKTLDRPDERLWGFSLAYYERSGVSRSLLNLQDQYDLDINLLLLAIWAGTKPAFQLKKDDFSTLDAVASNWRTRIVKPLRAVRRALKASAISKDPVTDKLRSGVAAAELDAEHLAQIALAKKISEITPLPTANESGAVITENLNAYFEYAGIKMTQQITDIQKQLVSQALT